MRSTWSNSVHHAMDDLIEALAEGIMNDDRGHPEYADRYENAYRLPPCDINTMACEWCQLLQWLYALADDYMPELNLPGKSDSLDHLCQVRAAGIAARATSEAKAAASRLNGLKGGRPPGS